MKNELPKRILSSLIIIPIAIFFIIKGSVIFMFFLSILFLATSYEWTIMSKKNNLLKLLGIIFLFISFLGGGPRPRGPKKQEENQSQSQC